MTAAAPAVALGGRRRWLATALSLMSVVGVIVSVRFGETASVVLPLAYGGAGVFVAWRRPANPIGWLLVLMGWGLTLGPLRVPASAERLLAGDLDPGVAVAAWGNSSGYSLAFAALVAITGLFPDGHLPVDRWRMATIATIVAATVSCVVICLNPVIAPTPVGSPTAVVVGNPFALAPDAAFWSRVPDMNTLYPVLATIVGVAAAGLVMRSRRASPVARMQYRWFIAAIVLVLVCTSIWAIATSAFAADSVGPLFFLAILSMAAIPIAIGVAIVRYRLFDIDRIISRTLGWAVVTGLLVAVFAAGVIAMQTALAGFTQGQTLAVAASTLLAFALFQPLRARVQRAVDRRFDRARYDAERTAIAFADRLREHTDIDAVASELSATTRAALAPSALGIWLRPSTPSP
jgi:hypothetical protein